MSLEQIQCEIQGILVATLYARAVVSDLDAPDWKVCAALEYSALRVSMPREFQLV